MWVSVIGNGIHLEFVVPEKAGTQWRPSNADPSGIEGSATTLGSRLRGNDDDE